MSVARENSAGKDLHVKPQRTQVLGALLLAALFLLYLLARYWQLR